MTFTSRLRIISLAASLLATPAMARTVAVNQANIVQSLAAAQPGDTLVLAAGGYGVVAIPRKAWQTPITIDARKASLTGLMIFRASGVNWVGGTIIGTLYGITIRDSTQISVSSTDISAAERGIVINDSSDVKILKNTLHHLQTDGIDVVGQRILVEGNTISDMRPDANDHPDGIQLWSANDEQTRDVTVRGNTVTGASQGIFGRAQTLGLTNIVVTGNKIQVDYGNGIVLLDTQKSSATDNRVTSGVNRINKANMRVEGGNNNILCGNVVPDVPKSLANLPCQA